MWTASRATQAASETEPAIETAYDETSAADGLLLVTWALLVVANNRWLERLEIFHSETIDFNY